MCSFPFISHLLHLCSDVQFNLSRSLTRPVYLHVCCIPTCNRRAGNYCASLQVAIPSGAWHYICCLLLPLGGNSRGNKPSLYSAGPASPWLRLLSLTQVSFCSFGDTSSHISFSPMLHAENTEYLTQCPYWYTSAKS